MTLSTLLKKRHCIILKQKSIYREIMKPFPLLILGLTLLFTPGCSYFGNQPLETLEYKAAPQHPNTNLFIFLRAFGGGHEIFKAKGMVTDVHERNIPFDMFAPSANYSYYSERTIVERLHEDVIIPARAEGYTNIWLVGVSMGGFGALHYYREKPEFINGMFLIFPYLGEEGIIDEIARRGGIKSWQPGNYNSKKEWEKMFWHWIQQENIGETDIPVILGYGSNDWYVNAHDLLADYMPEKNVIQLEGSHDFSTMKALWVQFLDQELYENDSFRN